MNGVILSPLSVIKYHGWGSEIANRYFLAASKDLWRKGGPSAFFKGVHTTIARDSMFGITYELVRNSLKAKLGVQPLEKSGSKLENMACDAIAASLATITSSPFNYARNRILATTPELKPPRIMSSWRALWAESAQQARRLAFLEDRLQIGWGTARVACSMAIGQYVYWVTKDMLENKFH
jgi:hypothetical protein